MKLNFKTKKTMKTKALMAGLLALGLCACTSDDNLVADGGDNASSVGENVYMQFTLQMPTTRSTTTTSTDDEYVKSSNGTQEGTTTENKVNQVTIVLADEDDNYITSALVNSLIEGSDTKYTAEFKASDLASSAGYPIHIYVYCNGAPSNLSTASGSDTKVNLDASYSLTSETDGTPWTDNNFYMSNAKSATATLPGDIESHTTADNPYDLGEVDVERAMARFDYKDASGSTGDNHNTYTIEEDDNDNKVTVTLVGTHLINMSKEFFYLRRVSDDGTNDDATISGVETASNYVVDTDADDKQEGYSSTLSSNFYYPMTTAAANFTYDEIPTTTDYSKIYYVTENTIPESSATDNENQQKGITTGIVFKGKINIPENSDLANSIDELSDGDDKRIYVFDEELVGTWSMIESAVQAGTASQALTNSYNKVKAVMDEDGVTDEEILQALNEALFIGYSPDDNGDYYTYYYYYNQHNTSEDVAMGPMEYAVVRNNVYQLSIKSIKKYGHPGSNEDPDPSPENPEDPDKSTDLYLLTELNILPWTLRTNEIEF